MRDRSGTDAPGQGTATAAERMALKAAAEWYAQLCSGMATEADREAWRLWHDQDPGHRRAWDRVEALQRRFQALPPRLSRTTLALASDRAGQPGRRAALKGIAALLTAGGAGWLTAEALPWPQWAADHRTATGERLDIRLPDGTRLLLNTASAVDVDFTETGRIVRLHAGEILVETAPDPAATPRPFLVWTEHGRIRALGTRFTVRTDAESSQVAVIEDAVEIEPHLGGHPPILVRQGEGSRFTASAAEPPARLGESETSWVGGMLLVTGWRLDELVAELGRYRSGRLGCDPAVGALRVSGAFPLQDTDRALAALERSLPVRILRRTRFWVSVEPR